MQTGHAIASGLVILFTLCPARAEPAPPPSAPTQPAVSTAPQAPFMTPPPPPWQERTKRSSTGRMVTGIVLTAVGAPVLIGGASIIVLDSTDGDDVRIAAVLVGIPLVLVGTALTAVGIPLWVSGSRQVPAGPEEEEARAIPQLFLGPTSASLRWTF